MARPAWDADEGGQAAVAADEPPGFLPLRRARSDVQPGTKLGGELCAGDERGASIGTGQYHESYLPPLPSAPGRAMDSWQAADPPFATGSGKGTEHMGTPKDIREGRQPRSSTFDPLVDDADIHVVNGPMGDVALNGTVPS